MSGKNFKDGAAGAINPALAFISQVREEQEQQRNTPPVTMPQPPETKSRRVQILLKPSTYNAIKERADSTYTSVNEWINAALERALKE